MDAVNNWKTADDRRRHLDFILLTGSPRHQRIETAQKFTLGNSKSCGVSRTILAVVDSLFNAKS